MHTSRWTLRGTAKVQGDVDAGTVTIQGSLSVGGSMTADEVRVDGALDVAGAVVVQGPFRTNGDLRAGASSRAGDLDLRGSSRVIGDVTADRGLASRGHLTANNVHAAAVSFDGAAEVPGEVVASRVVGKFDRDSRLGTVRAREVRLKGHVATPVDKVLFRRVEVAVERIEGESVELEAVTVEFVRSPAVVLGRDAHIAHLEGSVVRRHPTSHVGPESRSPPPHGLRR